MVKTYKYGQVTWTDLENPTSEEIESVAGSHRLHSVVTRELTGPSNSSKAVIFSDYVFLVLQFPIRTKKGGHHIIVDHEIDFIIGKDFVITTHYRSIESLENFAKAVETNAILEKDNVEDHAGHLFYYITLRMYHHMRNNIESVNSELTAAEDSIFSGKEKEMVEVISNLSRELLDFRQTCRAHFETLESLDKAKGAFFDQTFGPYVADIKENFAMVRDAVVNGHELAKELRETNDSLLTTKQNETMKVLTVVAFVTFPLSLFVELFSMNTVHTPIVGWPNDFWDICGMMVVLALFMVWYFRKKKWL
ncbi:MAG: CorA family divalent cation transporter [Candidatus Pacebacteria bacterium]|nr:CorA family divalent cation transporter [Candidatus Paceibacterota bacterium]